MIPITNERRIREATGSNVAGAKRSRQAKHEYVLVSVKEKNLCPLLKKERKMEFQTPCQVLKVAVYD